ncbi:MAG: hypothetical protein FH751_15870 [Firmicutes bacterium]|nr:hypothetical protein [Bacillota bacterium]
MKNEKVLGFKRITKVNCLILFFVAIILGIQLILEFGFKEGKIASLLVASSGVLGLVLYLLYSRELIPDRVIAVGLPILPTISAMLCLYFLNAPPRIFLVFPCASVMASFYFRKDILLMFAGIFNVFLITYFIIAPEYVIGSHWTLNEFVTRLIYIDSLILGLFFLTKWGNEVIKTATKKTIESEKLLNELKDTMEAIENNTILLNENIISSNESISHTKETSSVVTTSIQEIAQGVEEEAYSISEINKKMLDAKKLIVETQKISNDLLSMSNNANDTFTKGTFEVKNINTQMKIIKDAINSSVETVSELERSMESITKSLKDITMISEQTNLLALNASIEAARAGEAGKGFSVVANEIKELAEQSKTTANNVTNLINKINNQSKEAIEIVNKGNDAVFTGGNIVKNITSSYDDIQTTFNNIKDNINSEVKMMDTVTETFVNVQETIENIASITEEHSATTEQMLSSIEEQDERIIRLHDDMKNIKHISKELKDITYNNS